MEIVIFSFKSYKAYILAWLEAQPSRGRGLRKRIAETIGTQTGFVTQVLSGQAQFGQDQIFRLSKMMGHNLEEMQFFQLLLQHERAADKEFKAYLEGRLMKAAEANSTLSARLKTQPLSSAVDQSRYFSSWLYACIHVMTTCDRFRGSKAKMAEALKISEQQVSEVINFLTKAGLIGLKNGRYMAGKSRLHLGTDSEYLGHHHRNWNLISMQQVLTNYKTGLHYSSVASLSESDLEKVKEIFIRAMQLVK